MREDSIQQLDAWTCRISIITASSGFIKVKSWAPYEKAPCLRDNHDACGIAPPSISTLKSSAADYCALFLVMPGIYAYIMKVVSARGARRWRWDRHFVGPALRTSRVVSDRASNSQLRGNSPCYRALRKLRMKLDTDSAEEKLRQWTCAHVQWNTRV